MENISHSQLVIGVAAVAVAFCVGMPTLLTYILNQRREKRQNQIRDALLQYGPLLTGDFMFRCPQLSEDQRDKALKEMQRSGEIVPQTEFNNLVRWHFKQHPYERTQRRSR